MAAWGASTSLNVNYTDILLAKTYSGGWLRHLIRPQTNARLGAISVPVATAVTAQTPVDGTMLANNAARSLTALTAVWYAHTASVAAYQLDTYTEAERAAQITLFLDAARRGMEFEVITDLVAGTPAATYTLPTGGLDGVWTTDIMRQQVLSAVDQALGALLGNVSAIAGPADVFAVCNKKMWSNIMSATVGSPSGYPLVQLDGQVGSEMPARIMWRGLYPIYQYNGANVSGFSDGGVTGASDDKEDVLYWVHRDCEFVAWEEMTVSPMHQADDAFFKEIYSAFGYAGLIQATHYTAVANLSV